MLMILGLDMNEWVETPGQRWKHLWTDYHLGRVYFVRNPKTNLIKIGYSGNIVERFKQLRVNAKAKLELIGWIYGDETKEKELHSRFSAQAQGNEWFSESPDLLNFIATHATQGFPREAGYPPSKKHSHHIARSDPQFEVIARLLKVDPGLPQHGFSIVFYEEIK